MNSSLDSAFDRIRGVHWFTLVGDDATYPGSRLRFVPIASWQEATERRGTTAAANAFLEAANMFTCTLGSAFRSEYRKWNRFSGYVRCVMEEQIMPDIDALVDNIPEIAVADYGPALIKQSIRWLLAHYCMEQAYAELVQPMFYTEICEVYRAGRFRCDWSERWPDGRLWVY
jgi:hypothetical protein